MSGTVTIPSGNGTSASLSFGNAANSALATSIANAIAFTSVHGGNLIVANVTGQGGSPNAFVANTVPGSVGELIIPVGFTGVVSVTAADNYSYVIDESAGQDTIFGFPGVSIAAGGGTHTIVDPAAVVLGDTAGGSTNVVNISGTGDNVAVGNGHNTVTGVGSGTITGGTGNNLVLGFGSYVVNSNGQSDTVAFGAGAATVNTAGSNALVFGSSGALTGLLTGAGTSLVGGSGPGLLTVSGGGNDVFEEAGGMTVLASGSGDVINGAFGSGAFTVTVTGANDTIVSAQNATNVTLTGGASNTLFFGVDSVGPLNILDQSSTATIVASGTPLTNITDNGTNELVFGGPGVLNFIGGTNSATVVGEGKGATSLTAGTGALVYANAGGSGSVTVVGGSGGTTLFGIADGSDINFSNVAGAATYVGGAGHETLNAAGSTTNNLLIGVTDPTTGVGLLIGGSGNDTLEGAGGATTLTGGAGNNLFLFNKGDIFGAAPSDIVTDFTTDPQNLVLLANYGAGEAAAALAGATTAGGNTTITLSDNTKITFDNTSIAQLTGHIGSF